MVPIKLRLAQGHLGPQGLPHSFDLYMANFTMFPCQPIVRAAVFGQDEDIVFLFNFTKDASLCE